MTVMDIRHEKSKFSRSRRTFLKRLWLAGAVLSLSAPSSAKRVLPVEDRVTEALQDVHCLLAEMYGGTWIVTRDNDFVLFRCLPQPNGVSE
ncbi:MULTISPECIES: hypothetical protein [Rhizobium/Agrobacterium group]|uniref:Twin-arginine translocation signal domain-containing protein n=1 Tax=Agrobacterium vitis TaxID=373 RepID=A0ABD6H5I0_AGRVI|nr:MULTISPECIES: hypothetical protein [Rhizobium/Agrobacterium group]MUO27422.1 hypothetical protein [Agrobacterium vitis]MUO42128.1 hypothetical protein [Agrobacterium vitis]MUP09436.1 hypothetical protein [Agrobacterium vitis]